MMPARYPGQRLFDVVGSTVALAVSMPLQTVLAVTTKSDSCGPVLAQRSGDGHTFSDGHPAQCLSDGHDGSHRESAGIA